eukprot:COSAG01_NODE_9441_length_2426_cov_3.862378_1_plen_184_part_00
MALLRGRARLDKVRKIRGLDAPAGTQRLKDVRHTAAWGERAVRLRRTIGVTPPRAHTPTLLPPMGQVPPGTPRLRAGERLCDAARRAICWIDRLTQSSEIRVLTGFHAYPKKRFICKTRTGRPLVSAIRFWNLQLLKSHWSCMATKSGLIQVGLVCESPKAQQINQRFTVDRRINGPCLVRCR